ncbi:unnamed protein product [Calypogeia fissa]
MYRLRAQTDTSAMYQPVDFEERISTFGLPNDRPSPSHAVSMSEEILGGSIYNPATFSTVFQFTDEPYFGTEAHNQVRKEAFNGPNLNADCQPSVSLLQAAEICRFKGARIYSLPVPENGTTVGVKHLL